MPEVSVLYDGWALAYHPNSPAAIHLQTLLTCLPKEVKAYLALPAESFEPIPLQINPIQVATPASERGRLTWEQRTIPALVKKTGVNLLHLTTAGPALFSATRCLYSPTDSRALQGLADELQDWQLLVHRTGILNRLVQSLEQGGLSRARGVIWPADLPHPALKQPILSLPPQLIPTAWTEPNRELLIERLNLPDHFILSHGNFTEQDIRRLLEAWSWAADSIGEYYPLLVLGLDPPMQALLQALSREFGLNGTVHSLGKVSTQTMTELYSRCSAVFHSGPISIWGNSLRLAIASHKPIVALESRLADALVGPAAYLTKSGASLKETCRKLGAALVTIIVEEEVSEQLSRAAIRQAASWQQEAHGWEEGFTNALLSQYIQTAK